MARNTSEMLSNGINIAFFSKKLQKIAQRLGAGPPAPQSLRRLGLRPNPPPVASLSYTNFLNTFPKLDICIFNY